MTSPRILVVGGAGYIGSHMVKMLAAQSYRVTTLDNLSTGYRNAVSAGEFIQVDLADREVLATLFARQPFDAVMHFASYIQVGESVKEPSKYYAYNLGNGSGFSVAEVIAAAERVTGRNIPVTDQPRRAGDPPRLVADARRARDELGWRPQYDSLDTIIAHAWAWEQKLAQP